MWLFILLLLFVLLLLCIFDMRKDNRFDKRFPELPWRFPLVGHIPYLLLTRSKSLEYSYARQKQYKSPYYMTLPGVGMELVVNDPPSVQHILSDKFSNYPNPAIRRELGQEVWGDGIFMVNGDSWKYQRNLTKPIFTKQSLKQMVPIFQKHASVMLDLWEPFSNSENQHISIDIQDWFKRFTLDTFGEIGFGADIGSLSSPVEFSQLFDWIQDEVIARFFYPFRKITNQRAWKDSLNRMDRFVYDIITKRREELQQQTTNDSPGKTDLLTLYLQVAEDQQLSDKFIRDALMNFFIAGRDTTSLLCSWFFYFLSIHPDVEKRVIDEIDSVLGDSPPSFDNVKDLRYLRNVLDETLRYYPPAVPVVGKQAVEEDILPNGACVAAGQTVVYSAYVVHRLEEYWGEDSEDFNPDRWNKPLKHPYQFLPFQKGPRTCLGMDMAYLEAKIVISMIIQRGFRLRLKKDHQIAYLNHVTLPAKYGIQMFVESTRSNCKN